MKTAAYMIIGVLSATPIYAQNYQHHEDNPKYNSTKEDLTFQGWQTRQRHKDQQELQELRQHQIDEMKRHEDFDRLFPKENNDKEE